MRPQNMKQFLFLFFFVFFPVFAYGGGLEKVSLSPHSATFYFNVKINPENPCILIPSIAEGFRFDLRDAEISRIETVRVPGKSPGQNSMDKEREAVSARLKTVETVLKTFAAAPKNSDFNGLSEWQRLTLEKMPSLLAEKEELSEKLALFPKRENIPAAFPLKKIVFVFSGERREGDLRYSYDMPNCGWTPIYDIVADPEKQRIKVALFAKIRQFSGFDWKNAEIELTMGGNGGRLPMLRPWYLEARKNSARAGNMLVMDEAKPMAEIARNTFNSGAAKSAQRQVVMDNSGTFVSWRLPEKDAPQGIFMTKIFTGLWNDALERVIRPGISGKVPAFIMASHDFSNNGEGRVWPAGEAYYGILMPDGNIKNVGKNYFTPEKGKVALDFGPDWQVIADISQDLRQRDEKGLISTSNVWAWGWKYNISNSHDRAVNVRVERPLAQAVDKDIEVKYDNRPKAGIDRENKSLFWNVEIPASGMKEIIHQIEISAPQQMNFNPEPPVR